MRLLWGFRASGFEVLVSSSRVYGFQEGFLVRSCGGFSGRTSGCKAV